MLFLRNSLCGLLVVFFSFEFSKGLFIGELLVFMIILLLFIDVRAPDILAVFFFAKLLIMSRSAFYSVIYPLRMSISSLMT